MGEKKLAKFSIHFFFSFSFPQEKKMTTKKKKNSTGKSILIDKVYKKIDADFIYLFIYNCSLFVKNIRYF